MQMSLMRTRGSSIARAHLTADVTIKSTSYRRFTNAGANRHKNGIPETCRGTLAVYKVTLASFVRSLAVAVFGKLVRI